MSTLTSQQEQALDELMAHVPRADPPPAPPLPGMLETWLGISGGDLKIRLDQLLARKDVLEKKALDWVNANPLDANFEFLAACSWAFLRAEKGHNPRIATFIDAFYYIATCASVGYADIFAVTQTGKAIAALVMIVGPGLTNKALDGPAQPPGDPK